MPGWKTERVAELIREIVASTILHELRDPRIRGVTVTRVEVSADLQHAKVYVSIMGGEAEERQVLEGLKSATRYLQAKLARGLKTKHIPRLRFVVDRGVKHSIEVSRILRELEKERVARLEKAGQGVSENQPATTESEPGGVAEPPGSSAGESQRRVSNQDA